MKWLPLLLALLVPAAANASVLNGCMDCTTRFVNNPGGDALLVASCCMSMNGHCFEGDEIVEPNVGFGCLISAPDAYGNTSCESNKNDTYCQNGGKSTGPIGGFQGDGSGCVADKYGWCDISCQSCTQ